MPLQPVPTRPIGRRGRAATASVIAPVVALGLVVVVAWAGTVADWLSPDPTLRARGSDDRAPGVEPVDRPPAVADLSAAPPVAFRLPVVTVAETLARRHHGELGGGLVAVAGYLTVDPRDRECAEANGTERSATFCRRAAILTAGAEPILEVNWDEDGGAAIRLGLAGAHLHPQILPGTAIPRELVTRPDPRIRKLTPVPVVVVGRFDDPRALACYPGRRHCREEFVLERVVWAAGRLVDEPTVRDPAIPADEVAGAVRSARLIAAREIDRGEAILSRALVTVALLGEIDPLAAASVGHEEGAVWYVRSVARPQPGDDGRALAWAVIDEATGFVLAAGPEGPG